MVDGAVLAQGGVREEDEARGDLRPKVEPAPSASDWEISVSQSKVEDLQGRLIAVRYNWQLGLHIALAFPLLVRVPIRIEHCEPVQLARNV